MNADDRERVQATFDEMFGRITSGGVKGIVFAYVNEAGKPEVKWVNVGIAEAIGCVHAAMLLLNARLMSNL